MKILLRPTGVMIILMADFLVALGIVGFALAMLGLIWALERV
jgi:hypothetical protein